MKFLNSKILLSSAMVVSAAALVVGATFAYLSDSETSSNNSLTAGALDLQVDNDSYYNGAFNPGTSWLEKNLVTGDLFFNFDDVKPGDFGEDTISLHIKNNNAWVCSDTTLTAD